MERNGRGENKHTVTLIDLLLKLACLVLVQSIAVFNGKIVTDVSNGSLKMEGKEYQLASMQGIVERNGARSLENAGVQ